MSAQGIFHGILSWKLMCVLIFITTDDKRVIVNLSLCM